MSIKRKAVTVARKKLVKAGTKRAVKWLALPMPARVLLWLGIPVLTWIIRRTRKKQAA